MISSGKVAVGLSGFGLVEVSKCCSKVMVGESSEVGLGWEIIEKACSEGSS